MLNTVRATCHKWMSRLEWNIHSPTELIHLATIFKVTLEDTDVSLNQRFSQLNQQKAIYSVHLLLVISKEANCHIGNHDGKIGLTNKITGWQWHSRPIISTQTIRDHFLVKNVIFNYRILSAKHLSHLSWLCVPNLLLISFEPDFLMLK